MRVERTVRRTRRAGKIVAGLMVAAFSFAGVTFSKMYKESKVVERNSQTASIGKAVNRDVVEKASELRMAKLDAESDAKRAEFDAKFKAEIDKKEAESDARMAEFEARAKAEMKEFSDKAKADHEAFNQNSFDESFDSFQFDEDFFNDYETTMPLTETTVPATETTVAETTAPVEEKTEYYLYGTVDKNGCYAEPGELFDERERLMSVDPSEVSYNWAVHVKDGKAVEAWTSTDALKEADLKPYTKEEQIKQYGSLRGGKSENVTGYWHTAF